ncbi:hypothetical protein RHMOL_Rhmol12G0187200 [Rhododendron molle]|uniref:Uncharacterized protein n=1 Tax=Rhododendron molle TaxID=49168 RepID=A0ACC0LLA5_RHOML|nr:hypothetical protein RHMOL_Rhmol12G0187200 [Rhododendron molle]
MSLWQDLYSILFWKDTWLGNTSLSLKFPTLFNVVCFKEECLGDVLVRKAIFNECNFVFRRNLFDWEKELQTELSHLLDVSGVVARDEREDRLSWFGCNSNVFSVKSFYNLFRAHPSNPDKTFELIWRNAAPHRVQCFGWLVYLGRVKTSEYHLRLGIINNEEEALCKFCFAELETADHLLLHCKFVWDTWGNVLSWWGIQGPLPNALDDLYRWWDDWNFKAKKRIIWDCLLFAVLWTIWLTRNEAVFNQTSPNWCEMQETIKIRVALRVKTKTGDKEDYSMDDFIFKLGSIIDDS